MASGRALRPRDRLQCTSASSWPWVTQISEAPVAAMVLVNPSQSAWSEITSGNSTPRCRARARTRIQPEAKLAQVDPAADVVAGDRLQRAMQINRLVVARLANERDHPLRLAERIRADE